MLEKEPQFFKPSSSTEASAGKEEARKEVPEQKAESREMGGPEKINEKLRQEILMMANADQEMRKSLKHDPEVDIKNTERMKELVKQYGWPGKSLVGEDGAREAWLLVQHADHDVEFQKQALGLLEKAVEKGEASKRNLAYLVDRVRVNSGEPQIFGTQFYVNKEGKYGPRPIEDLKRLEKIRKEFGLEPFSDYEKRMQERGPQIKERKVLQKA